MINRQMKLYSLWRLGSLNAYGQPTARDTKQKIKMAINLLSQTTADNIAYKDAQYIGLTFYPITDKDIVINGQEKLKVIYVNKMGRINQVFMVTMPNG